MVDFSEESFFKFIKSILHTPSNAGFQYRWQDMRDIMGNKDLPKRILDLAEVSIGLNNDRSMQEIEKLKLSSTHHEKVSLGLTSVGLILFGDYGLYHFQLKYVD